MPYCRYCRTKIEPETKLCDPCAQLLAGATREALREPERVRAQNKLLISIGLWLILFSLNTAVLANLDPRQHIAEAISSAAVLASAFMALGFYLYGYQEVGYADVKSLGSLTSTASIGFEKDSSGHAILQHERFAVYCFMMLGGLAILIGSGLCENPPVLGILKRILPTLGIS